MGRQSAIAKVPFSPGAPPDSLPLFGPITPVVSAARIAWIPHLCHLAAIVFSVATDDQSCELHWSVTGPIAARSHYASKAAGGTLVTVGLRSKDPTQAQR